uniref:Uncharacterized protein n=1 Tax=Parascaris univalens TaxID=6257 RepID=A0A915CGP2_PARUN
STWVPSRFPISPPSFPDSAVNGDSSHLHRNRHYKA